MDGFSSLLPILRRERPLIHCISNVVTARDCANLLLAVGASPIMAQAPEEAAEIAALARAVVLNTGTPSSEKFLACRLAGEAANRLGIPVVLDPVGVGASSWRREELLTLLDRVHPALLRVNYGEAAALLYGWGEEHGVDSLFPAGQDAPGLAAALARRYGSVVVLTGAEDIVTDGAAILTVSGGSPLMKQITGAGCMLSALCGAFAAVTPSPLKGGYAAAAFWKEAAAAAHRAVPAGGLGSFFSALMDAASLT